jgi:ABC-type transport system substrate-binding protein
VIGNPGFHHPETTPSSNSNHIPDGTLQGSHWTLRWREIGLDDADENFYENYACGAARNYGGYCNQEVDALIDRQSIETDPEKRRLLVWEIERKLIEDDVRPVLFHPRAAVCNQPWVKG